MTCFHPITAYYSRVQNPTGKYSLVFNYENSDKTRESVRVPCRKCIGCLLDQARDVSVRAYHESLLYDNNCFITLTYDNEHLPADRSVSKREFQLFMKRLRKYFSNIQIRFLACGEYGAQTNRPHYHALLFGIDFLDKTAFSRSRAGYVNYVSATLAKLWPFGHHTINSVSINSCGYVARYVTKKLFHSSRVLPTVKIDGRYYQVQPEFCLRSLRPGLGHDYFLKFYSDFYSVNSCLIDGKRYSIPAYYDLLLERYHSDLYEQISEERKIKLEEYKLTGELTSDRLRVREQVFKHHLNRSNVLARNL